VLEPTRVGGRHADDLDLGRNEVERKVVAVAGEEPDRETEPVGGDGGEEGRAARARRFADAVEGDVPDGDEVRRAHARVRGGAPWRWSITLTRK